ncbi:MAG: hypothetical protein JWQ81_2535 [Amycolatopsis sp.]|uniref:DUF4188 domain-containing protein n=1 Tax=Amycolatopsis sp. TaxID=37632 RepID=UPI002636F633|nr:DUF4188 domain-containing protein [Amycolatopsis sp.]MCU1681796.1 hypothetical protein [Amycolatopsis sp.]
MGQKVHNGRWTTGNSDDVVLFLLGIRINKLTAVRKWLPVIRALPPMLAELTEQAGSGLLASRTQMYGVRELTLLQYWSSVKQLMDFAHDTTHRRAWRDFYRIASRSSEVGIWHETFVVPAGRYESIYGNVPTLGLATTGGLTPIGRRNDSARARLGETE